MKKLLLLFMVAGLAIAGAGCEGDSEGGGTTTLRFAARADFGEGTVAGALATAALALETECPVSSAQDNPNYAAGLDCDGDGAPVAYLTPTAYRVAFKRLTFVHADLGEIDVIPDTGTLAAAEVHDLTQEITLDELDVPAGHFIHMEIELVYFELVLEDGPAPRTIRIYLSDDDFPAEGNGGHHQGDITLIGEDGSELGFVGMAQPWTPGALLAERGDTQGGGGVDAETGHARGLFGDAGFWNRQELRQGPDQDVYLISQPISAFAEAGAATATLVFDVADSWFFEDFGNNGQFNPCVDDIEACAIGAGWGPLFYPPTVELD